MKYIIFLDGLCLPSYPTRVALSVGLAICINRVHLYSNTIWENLKKCFRKINMSSRSRPQGAIHAACHFATI